MVAGRTPIPSVIHQLRGNPGNRPLNDREPATPPLSINPPEHLDDDAKEFWYAVGNTVRAMNVAQESDRMALELLSICLAEVRRAYEQLQKGRTVVYESGAEQVSPHFTIMSKLI